MLNEERYALSPRLRVLALVLLSPLAVAACSGSKSVPVVSDASVRGAAAAPQLVQADPLAMLEHGLRPSLLAPGETLPQWSLRERMAHHKVPGVAVALIRNGEVVAARGYGTREAGKDEPVDGATLFSVGSVSKVVAATLALQLVAEHRLELDRDVNAYLKSWQLPASPQYAQTPVTLRMLLSHTAGTSVRGFDDFQPGEPLPSVRQILDGEAPAKNGPVRIERQPGLLYRYSGGGIMLAQLLVEETRGTSFEAVAQHFLFGPLGMRRSTFAELPENTENVAKAHDGKGLPRAQPRGWESFPEASAAGLWTNAEDLGRFVAGLLRSYRGGEGPLPQTLAFQMMTEVAPSVHGLGPRLGGAGRSRVFHHGGSNDNYHARIEGYLESGDGFVILTNSDEGGPRLRNEIRNAFVDALGHAPEPPLQQVKLDLGAAGYADYAGSYRLDESVPMEYREFLTELFNPATVTVQVQGGGLAFRTSESDRLETLAPLATSLFVPATRTFPVFEFHRDAFGKVRGLSLRLDKARAYYRREAG